MHRHERSQSFVRRSLRLPEHADLVKVAAKYVDGVLHVEVRASGRLSHVSKGKSTLLT